MISREMTVQKVVGVLKMAGLEASRVMTTLDDLVTAIRGMMGTRVEQDQEKEGHLGDTAAPGEHIQKVVHQGKAGQTKEDQKVGYLEQTGPVRKDQVTEHQVVGDLEALDRRRDLHRATAQGAENLGVEDRERSTLEMRDQVVRFQTLEGQEVLDLETGGQEVEVLTADQEDPVLRVDRGMDNHLKMDL